jgi:hypothetical protein
LGRIHFRPLIPVVVWFGLHNPKRLVF